MIIMNFSSGSEVNHTYQISLEIFSIDCCNTVTPREYQQFIGYFKACWFISSTSIVANFFFFFLTYIDAYWLIVPIIPWVSWCTFTRVTETNPPTGSLVNLDYRLDAFFNPCISSLEAKFYSSFSFYLFTYPKIWSAPPP